MEMSTCNIVNPGRKQLLPVNRQVGVFPSVHQEDVHAGTRVSLSPVKKRLMYLSVAEA